MTTVPQYTPLLALDRGTTHESVHYGAIAIVDSHDNLVASCGDPETITFMRSTAKPLQAIPFIEAKGHQHWGLTQQEIAILCASHIGTNEHIKTVKDIQAKINVTEDDLLCGTHQPIDTETANALILREEQPSPVRHNCSGKHTGMLAYARLLDLPIDEYIHPEHPIQKQILDTFSVMCAIEPEEIALGTDGCSAPNFAIPLRNAALGIARLCDPHELPAKRAAACQTIAAAMIAHPRMVSGNGRFDTCLMEVAQGRVICKGGAEGYLGIGIMPGVLDPNNPGVGITIKIADGDLKGRARPAVALEVLRQLGVLSPTEFEKLSTFGPHLTVRNWRQLNVGESYPIFELTKKSEQKT